MEIAFAAADLVLCRSGAGTLNELVTHEMPSILVPWPGASENHQQHNAQVLESRGGAMVLEQQAIDTLPTAIGLAKERLVQMRQSLRREKESLPPPLKDWITKQLDTCKNTTT
jgi:UDP-N-acetylglucosamine--N-acetylmuramyl-(pentapeptide) pyrophosphoryl-undecaprenol N-acetylglucosamine transferase